MSKIYYRAGYHIIIEDVTNGEWPKVREMLDQFPLERDFWIVECPSNWNEELAELKQQLQYYVDMGLGQYLILNRPTTIRKIGNPEPLHIKLEPCIECKRFCQQRCNLDDPKYLAEKQLESFLKQLTNMFSWAE